MKKIIIIIFCACICCKMSFSQHIYFGYPPDSISLEKNDRIIVNLPIFNVDHKYFLYDYQFKDFANLLETHQEDSFCVEINYFFSSDSSFAKYSSDKLCDNFKKMMSRISNKTNYEMKSNGCSNPIYFCRDENYIHYNNRMEIVIERSDKHVMAQQMDTICFYTPELKVNNQSFLYDLDSILLQHCSKCDTNKVYLIDIDQKREYVYQLEITGTLWEVSKNAKGYFIINNKYFFVKGILPENPKPLFTQTDNVSRFFYEVPHYDPNEFCLDVDGDCCSLLLEYRYQKLFFLKNLWEQ